MDWGTLASSLPINTVPKLILWVEILVSRIEQRGTRTASCPRSPWIH